MPAVRTVVSVEPVNEDVSFEAEVTRGEHVFVPGVRVALSCGHAFRMTGMRDDDPDPALRTPRVGDSFPCSLGDCTTPDSSPPLTQRFPSTRS